MLLTNSRHPMIPAWSVGHQCGYSVTHQCFFSH